MRSWLILICLSACAQVADQANSGYKTEQDRKSVARGLVSKDRDERQRPRELVAAMDVKPGMTVADVGTGAGYMLPFLSEAVGPSGRVIAEDLFPDFLQQARQHASGLKNVEFVLGSDHSAKLTPGSADRILVLDAFHHFDYPKDMLASLLAALKPDGRLTIVEYHKNERSMPGGRALTHIRFTEDQAIAEVEAAGFRLITKKDHIPDVQWLAIFRKP